MKSLDESIIEDFIIQDFTYRFIIDDVSEGREEEYRCSIYDQEMNLAGEGWGSNPREATLQAMEGSE